MKSYKLVPVEVKPEKEMRKIIIAGGRDFLDRDLLFKTVTDFIDSDDLVQIVSGCAPGADTLGLDYAAACGYEVKKFPADWDKHGKAAGPIRNRQMAEYADECIVFWDGKSRGTKSMIDEAMARKLRLTIVEYK
jgi:hypothetical protein